MSKIIPRVRGNAIQDGKHWTWEMEILIGPVEPIVMRNKEGRFLNREAALNDLRHHSIEVLKVVCEQVGCPLPTEVINLNDGVAQTPEEFSKPVSYQAPKETKKDG